MQGSLTYKILPSDLGPTNFNSDVKFAFIRTSIDNKYDVLNNLGDYGAAGFNVYTKPVNFTSTENESITIPNKKVLVRDDNHNSVGIVGSKYEVAQHPDAFRTVERI